MHSNGRHFVARNEHLVILLFEWSFTDKFISFSLNDLWLTSLYPSLWTIFHWQAHIFLFEWLSLTSSYPSLWMIFNWPVWVHICLSSYLFLVFHWLVHIIFFCGGVNHWAVFLWPVYMFLCVWLFIDQCISFSLYGISFEGFHWPVQVFLFVISSTEQNILFQQLFSSQHRFFSDILFTSIV